MGFSCEISTLAKFNKQLGNAATLAGIETAHMIRKGQIGQKEPSAFKQFAALVA